METDGCSLDQVNVKYKAHNHLLLILDDFNYKYLNLPIREGHTASLVSKRKAILLFVQQSVR